MTRVLFFCCAGWLFVCSSALVCVPAMAQINAGGPIVQPGAAGPGPVGPVPGGQAPIAPAMPQPPEWAGRMSAEEIKWIDDVLRFWETRSDKVKLFECKFQRWDYDGGFVDPAGKRHSRSYA